MTRGLAFAAAALGLVAACEAKPSAERSPRHDAVEREFGRRRAPEPDGARASSGAASFGLYVLSLGWTPSFCCGHPEKGECQLTIGDFATTHLTLHGLWPNYTDAESAAAHTAYPAFCGRFAACRGAHPPAFCTPDPTALPPEMASMGPGYVQDHHFLADHEWPKHGGCTGLSAAAYFGAALAAMKRLPGSRGTPELLEKSIGGDVAIAELAQAFGERDSVLLSCDAHCTLEQVGVCLGHDRDGFPTARVACPANTTHAQYDNGCVTRGCATVHVPAFGACDVGAAHGDKKAKPRGGACSHPGQGPACSDDAACASQGYARCARSGCCTSVPR